MVPSLSPSFLCVVDKRFGPFTAAVAKKGRDGRHREFIRELDKKCCRIAMCEFVGLALEVAGVLLLAQAITEA